MSNNDDFDFNRDDLFDDFDDDSGGDDFGGDDFSSDDFDFGDESEDFNLDDDSFGSDIDNALADDDDFGGGDDDFGADETTTTGGGGSNRNFIVGVIALLVVFAIGIGLIVWLSTREDPATVAFNETKSAIETANAIAQTQIAESATAGIVNATSTQSAIETATAQFTPPSDTPTATLTPTEDLTATALEQQNQQVFLQQTVDAQVAIDATNTEIAFQQTLNPDATLLTLEAVVVTVTTDAGAPTVEATISIDSVQQTATALAILFSTPPTQAGVQPTDIVTTDGTQIVIGGGTPSGTTTTGQGDGALPNTGLFDEVFQSDPTFIFIAAFGLLGVIVFSRTVRKRNGS